MERMLAIQEQACTARAAAIFALDSTDHWLIGCLRVNGFFYGRREEFSGDPGHCMPVPDQSTFFSILTPDETRRRLKV